MSTLTDPAQHPTWCTRVACQARGWHTSSRMTVDQADDRTSVAYLSLVQLLAADTETHVVIAGADDAGVALLLTPQQARIMRRFLYRLVELAEQ